MNGTFNSAFKKILSGSIALCFLAVSGFMFAEPTLSSAATDSFVVTQTVTADIALTGGGNITLRTLNTSVQTAVGSTTWNVETNNGTGYTLTVHSTSTPAMLNTTSASTTDGFGDYTDASGPETWSVTNDYEFGFSAFGSDVESSYGTDTKCSSASSQIPSTGLNWEGFQGATTQTLATSTAATGGSGVDTTVCIADEWDTLMPPSGSYQATVVVTATANP